MVLCGVAYRLMFSASVSGFLGNALADMVFFCATVGLLVASVRHRGPRLKVTAAWAALALFFIACLITTRTAANPRAAVEPLMNLAALVCLFLAVSGAVYAEADAPRAAAFLVSLAAIPLVIASYQYFHEFPRILEEGVALPGWVGGVYIDEKSAADFRTRVETMRAFATFLTPNVLAGVMALVLPVTLSLGVATAASPLSASAKIAPLVAAGLMTVLEMMLLVVTKSKAGFAAAALAVGIFLLFVLKRLVGWKAFASILAAVAVLFAAAVALDPPRAKRYVEEAKKSLEVRVGYWQTSWRMIKAEPLSGAGLGNFGDAYVMVKEIGVREVQDPHNWFLKTWAEGGVFALLFFLAFWTLVLVGRRDPAAGRAGPGGRACVLAVVMALLLYFATEADFVGVDRGLTASVIAGAAASIVLIILLVPAAAALEPSFVLAGLAAGLAGFLLHGLTDVDFGDAGAAAVAVFAAAAFSPRGRHTWTPAKAFNAALLAFLACVALVLFVWRILLPLSQAQLAMSDAAALLENRRVQASADRALEAMQLDSHNPYIPTFLGRLYAASPSAKDPSDRFFTAAEGFFRRSLALDARYRPAHEGLASLYAAAGPECLEKAIEQRKILLLLYPNNSFYRVAAGRLLERAGRLEEARDHYRMALEINDWTEEHGQQFTREERLGLRADVARLNAAIEAAGSN